MMIATVQEIRTCTAFSKRLAKNLKQAQQALGLALQTGRGAEGRRSVERIQAVDLFEHDLIHVFNHDAFETLWQTLETEVEGFGEGELVIGLGPIKHFLDRKKNYTELAKTTNGLRIWAQGNLPARAPRIEMVPLSHPSLQTYRVLFFWNEKHSGALVAKLVDESKDSTKDGASYIGFYTFNPFWVQTLQRSWALACSGLDSMVELWEQELNMPTLSEGVLKDIEQSFFVNSKGDASRVGAPQKLSQTGNASPVTLQTHHILPKGSLERLPHVRAARRCGLTPSGSSPRVIRVPSSRKKKDPDFLA